MKNKIVISIDEYNRISSKLPTENVNLVFDYDLNSINIYTDLKSIEELIKEKQTQDLLKIANVGNILDRVTNDFQKVYEMSQSDYDSNLSDKKDKIYFIYDDTSSTEV